MSDEIKAAEKSLRRPCDDQADDETDKIPPAVGCPSQSLVDDVLQPTSAVTDGRREPCRQPPTTEGDPMFGWVIVAASFVNLVIVGVMFIAFSMLYVELVDQFDTSKASAGWIGSLFLATGNICGQSSFYGTPPSWIVIVYCLYFQHILS